MEFGRADADKRQQIDEKAATDGAACLKLGREALGFLFLVQHLPAS